MRNSVGLGAFPLSQAVGVVAMQMPSLFKYFAFVGAALLALISLANFLLDPSTGASMVQTTAKPLLRSCSSARRLASIERWRNEQAALKAAEQAQTATKRRSPPNRPPSRCERP